VLNPEFMRDGLSLLHRRERLGMESIGTFIKERYLFGKPVSSALSLCCGDGFYDRQLYADGLFARATCLDEGVLEIAAATSNGGNIPLTYLLKQAAEPIDLPEQFPLIYSFFGLEKAGDVLGAIFALPSLLEKGGVFWFVGYCGPQREPLMPHEANIVHRLLNCFPEGFRQPNFPIGAEQISMLYDRGSNRGSHFIESALKSTFERADVIDLGGTLTYPLWCLATRHLDYTRDENVSITLMLQAMEESLIRQRIITSSIKMIICRGQ
jgi:hypothetical protein